MSMKSMVGQHGPLDVGPASPSFVQLVPPSTVRKIFSVGDACDHAPAAHPCVGLRKNTEKRPASKPGGVIFCQLRPLSRETLSVFPLNCQPSRSVRRPTGAT